MRAKDRTNLTTEDMAKFANVSLATMRSMISRGHIDLSSPLQTMLSLEKVKSRIQMLRHQ